MIEADLGEPCLACIPKPPEVARRKASAACEHRAARILALRDAVIVIGVDLSHLAARVADRDDATTFVGVEVAFVGEPCAFVSEQRFISAGAVDVAAQEAGDAVKFKMGNAVCDHQIVELADRSLRRDQPQLAKRVVAKIGLHRAARPRYTRQTVLARVNIAFGVVARKVGIAVIGERRAPRRGVLIETVVGVRTGEPCRNAVPREQIIAPRSARDLACCVVGEARRHIMGCVCKVMREVRQARGGVISISRHRPVAPRQAQLRFMNICSESHTKVSLETRSQRVEGTLLRACSSRLCGGCIFAPSITKSSQNISRTSPKM